MTKTNPTNVYEAHYAAYSGKMNLVKCANHCGMTLREFKMSFHEFLKYNPPQEWGETNTQLNLF